MTGPLLDEVLATLCQYQSDLTYPPEGESRERRIARVKAVIAKVVGSTVQPV